MKKIIFLVIISILFFLVFPLKTNAIYDPTASANNKFGIHILFPEEIDQAANLINSSGGDWGYVTVPIRDSDRDLIKWQKFMDDCRKFHVIPLLRIATDGDYFVKGSWTIPSNLYVIDFANFLDSLNWPTKNRYVIIFNETNRGDEWGGSPDAAAYAKILDFSIDAFKKRSDKFFIIMGGLDNASINIPGTSVYQLTYLQQMEDAVPGLFKKLDGLSIHAYPNPAFSTAPNYTGTNGISSFKFEQNLVKEFSGKTLPVFITETGWTSTKIDIPTQIEYYKEAFKNVWNDKTIIAVTPFLLHAETDPFRQFSFILDNHQTDLYKGYQGIPKTKGSPQIEPETIQTTAKSVVLRTRYFTSEFSKNIANMFNPQARSFMRWLFNF